MDFGIGEHPGTSCPQILECDCTCLLIEKSSQYVYQIIDFEKAYVKSTCACFPNYFQNHITIWFGYMWEKAQNNNDLIKAEVYFFLHVKKKKRQR